MSLNGDFDYQLAVDYEKTMSRIAETIEWKGFGQITYGLNWKMPLVSVLDFKSWTMLENSESGGILRVYRTRRRVERNHTRENYVNLFSRGKDEEPLSLTLPETSISAPSPGDIIDIVVEIWTGLNERHSIPYARVSEPGPFSDWGNLNRIGKL